MASLKLNAETPMLPAAPLLGARRLGGHRFEAVVEVLDPRDARVSGLSLVELQQPLVIDLAVVGGYGAQGMALPQALGQELLSAFEE